MQAPTLVLRGAHDPIVSQQWAERVAQLLPQGQLKVIPRVAHAMHYSEPLEFMSVTEAFINTPVVSIKAV
jgi:2-hydroxy-6-oxonona-2,4-dienedioate hydrolase